MKNKLRLTAGLIALSLTLTGFSGVFETTFASAAESGKRFPSKYDLRDDGFVTPVKRQNPFGTCWAFGCIAAAESSILSDSGMTYEETVDENGNGLDLSEKHLAWYVTEPVSKTENPSQAGEGRYSSSQSSKNRFNAGGFNCYVTSIFASGGGPLPETLFPYRGKNGAHQSDWLESLSDEELLEYCREHLTSNAKADGETLEQYAARMITEKNLAEGLTDYDPVELFLKWAAKQTLTNTKKYDCYSEEDDWSIPETYRDDSGNVRSNRTRSGGYLLKDGNVLPEPAIVEQDKNAVDPIFNSLGRVWKGINEDGTEAIKQELMNGRGVAVSFRADSSRPGQLTLSRFMNPDTWAHYTYENRASNHVVCIVGWDDNYSASNFNAEHRPPGNGAWLVKNSWGSETDYRTLADGFEEGKYNWGIVSEDGRHTGYFWLSYYDKSIEDAGTFRFTKTSSAQPIRTLQYDYLPPETKLSFKQEPDPVKAANIFRIPKDDPGLTATSVSTKTANQNSRVSLSIYRLQKGWKNPTDGTCLYRTSRNFEYAGYHRIQIAKGDQCNVKPGETVAVIATETNMDDSGKRWYNLDINSGFDKASEPEGTDDPYSKAVVNKGESYLYYEGEWGDWLDFLQENHFTDTYAIDNFSIKLLGVDAPKEAQKLTAKNRTVTVKARVGKGKTLTKSSQVSVTGGVKSSGNGSLSYQKKSGAKKIYVTSSGKIYAGKGTKPGTYRIKVLIKAAETPAYRAASTTMTVTVRVKKK